MKIVKLGPNKRRTLFRLLQTTRIQMSIIDGVSTGTFSFEEIITDRYAGVTVVGNNFVVNELVSTLQNITKNYAAQVISKTSPLFLLIIFLVLLT